MVAAATDKSGSWKLSFQLPAHGGPMSESQRFQHREAGMQDCRDKKCVMPNPHEGVCDQRPPVEIDYVNWKNIRRKRRISPTGQVLFTSNEWHPEPQWLLGAIDHEDGKHKLFALSTIHGWRECKA